MSSRDELDLIDETAARLIPALTERLSRHELGEIEVRRGELRVRVAASASASHSRERSPAPEMPTQGAAPGHPGPASQPIPVGGGRGSPASAHGVTSPAVGYFAYVDGLGVGVTVQKGDPLGHVDVLGVRHDVRAPRSGVVRNLVTEAGEAVEYGQLLIELEGSAP